MSVYICIHCGEITHCDFFPCETCTFRTQSSELCLKLLQLFSDDVADICETCHEMKGKIKKVMLVSSGPGNYFCSDGRLRDSIETAFCNMTEEGSSFSERRIIDWSKQPKNALNKNTQRYLKQSFAKRRFR